jgi:hypothetical protein
LVWRVAVATSTVAVSGTHGSEAVIVGVRPAREADLGPGEAVTVIMPLVIVPPHTVRGTVWTVEVFVAGKFKGEGYTGVATVTYVLCLGDGSPRAEVVFSVYVVHVIVWTGIIFVVDWH